MELEFVVSEGPSKGKVLPFPGRSFVIGSGADCQLRMEPSLVRSRHAAVSTDNAGVVWVRDVSGAKLLWINGEVKDEGKLTEGTFLRLGRLELVVRSRNATQSGPSGTLSTPTPIGRRPQSRTTNQRPPDPGFGLEPTATHPPDGSLDETLSPSGRNPQISFDATAKRPTPLDSGPVDESGVARAMDRARRMAAAEREGPRPSPTERGVRSQLMPGQVIDGRYRIVARLAAGGMGEVYKAEHVELGKQFALKVMLPELSTDPEFVARFKREAIASSRIGQQNIVDISDFGRTQDGRFFFVMEFLEGLTLASVVHREKALSLDRVIAISLQVARALAAAHAQSIVHRDLKPENVMLLQRPGQPDLVKVLDFGVAKVSHGHGEGGHTAIGMVVGTPQYMSPEQAKAIPVDARSDIYSLGLIVYELLCGRPAFVGETPPVLMVKQVTEMPPPLEPGPREPTPPDLEGLLWQMLAKKPDERPQTMSEVVERLEVIWAQTKTGPFPKTATPRPVSTRVSASGRFSSPSQLGSAIQPLPESGLMPAAPTSGPQSGVRRPPSGVQRPPSGLQRPPSGVQAGLPTQPEAFDAGLAEEAPLAPPRSKLPLVLVGLAVLGAAATAGVLALKGPSEQPRPIVVEVPPPVKPPEPKPQEPVKEDHPPPLQVKLTVKSEPPGAEVYQGEAMVGNTPLELKRDKGSVQELTLKLSGYKPLTRKVLFDSESDVNLSLEKEARAAGPGPGPKKPKDDLHADPYEVKQTQDLKSNPFQ